MKKVAITILAMALVAMGTIFVVGQTAETDGETPKYEKKGKHGHFGKRGKRGKRGKMARLFRHLDLTDEQKAQMKTIRQTAKETTKPIRTQMRQNKQTLRQLSEGGTFDEAQVTAIAQQQGNLMAQMIVEKEKTKAAMFAILTDEQKAKMAQFKQMREERRAARKARMAEKKNEQ